MWRGEEEDAVNVDFGLSKPRLILFPVPPLFSVLCALHSMDIGVDGGCLRKVLGILGTSDLQGRDPGCGSCTLLREACKET